MGFNFEKLECYQMAIEFVDQVYSLTNYFPKEELFGLTNQFRKAAVSIPLNIAEDSARTKRGFNRFIDMARGSAFECVAILQVSVKRGYISLEKFNELRDRVIDISKMLSGLKRSLAPVTANTA